MKMQIVAGGGAGFMGIGAGKQTFLEANGSGLFTLTSSNGEPLLFGRVCTNKHGFCSTM